MVNDKTIWQIEILLQAVLDSLDESTRGEIRGSLQQILGFCRSKQNAFNNDQIQFINSLIDQKIKQANQKNNNVQVDNNQSQKQAKKTKQHPHLSSTAS